MEPDQTSDIEDAFSKFGEIRTSQRSVDLVSKATALAGQAHKDHQYGPINFKRPYAVHLAQCLDVFEMMLTRVRDVITFSPDAANYLRALILLHDYGEREAGREPSLAEFMSFFDGVDLGPALWVDICSMVRYEHETYYEYIQRVTSTIGRKIVKYCDMTANLSLNCTPSMTRRYLHCYPLVMLDISDFAAFHEVAVQVFNP